jgi:hypothetical protein
MVMHPHTKYNELSGKTKKLWSGQASPKRNERRKNQTKTMSPFVRRRDIIMETCQDWKKSVHCSQFGVLGYVLNMVMKHAKTME